MKKPKMKNLEITVTQSTESVVPECEKRLMAMINGETPKDESEARMQEQVKEITKKRYIIEIPSN